MTEIIREKQGVIEELGTDEKKYFHTKNTFDHLSINEKVHFRFFKNNKICV